MRHFLASSMENTGTSGFVKACLDEDRLDRVLVPFVPKMLGELPAFGTFGGDILRAC